MNKVILITGCSSGIGRDLANRLSRSGFTVAATARNEATLASLDADLKIALDVTQPDSIQKAVQAVIERFGRIDVLVNNAGYAVCGAIEEVPVDQAQRMFDANVFGVMRMSQAVLPYMRRQGSGRIINISSVVGKLVVPVNGAYSATKFALEALSDALRMELEPFGVQVVLVEPGSVKTNFHSTVQTNTMKTFANPNSPYRSLYDRYQQVNADMRKGEAGPEAVSSVVQLAIEAGRPKARYVAGFPLTGRLTLVLGGSVWERVVKSMFRIAPAAR